MAMNDDEIGEVEMAAEKVKTAACREGPEISRSRRVSDCRGRGREVRPGHSRGEGLDEVG